MSSITYQIRNEAVEKLSADPNLHGDNLGFALQRIGETGAEILDVEDVSFWQISRTGEFMLCIAAHNNIRGPVKTIMHVGMNEIKEYIQALHEVLYLDIADISRETNINRLARKFLSENDELGASLHVPIFINGAVNGFVQFNKVGAIYEWSLEVRE